MKEDKVIRRIDSTVSHATSKPEDKKKSGELNHQFSIGSKCHEVRSVNVTPDKRYLIITNANNPGIRVLDLELLEYKSFKFNHHTKSVRLTSIAGDGSAFYTASWDGNCYRYDLHTGEYKSMFDRTGLPMPSCTISPDEKYLFTAHYESVSGLGSQNRGRCNDLISGKIYEYPHQQRKYFPGAMDIGYDEEHVYTGSDDGQAFKWSLRKQKTVIQFFDLQLSVRKVAVSKRFFAAACSDGITRIFYKSSGKKYMDLFHAKNNEVMDIKITQTESRLISASSNGSIKCFDLHTGETIFKKKIHYSWIWSICLYDQDQKIVSGSTDGTIVFMDIQGNMLARLYNLSSAELLIRCFPDEKEIIYPGSYFYASDSKFVAVYQINQDTSDREELDRKDEKRKSYIKKLNRKNIVIAKLNNQNNYQALTEKYAKNKKLLDSLEQNSTMHLLNQKT